MFHANAARSCLQLATNKNEDLKISLLDKLVLHVAAVSLRSCCKGSEVRVQCDDREEPRSDPGQEVSPENIQVTYCTTFVFTAQVRWCLHKDLEADVLDFHHRQCCSGKELVDWLMKQNEGLQSRSQAVGMWQVLVDEGILAHGKKSFQRLRVRHTRRRPVAKFREIINIVCELVDQRRM